MNKLKLILLLFILLVIHHATKSNFTFSHSTTTDGHISNCEFFIDNNTNHEEIIKLNDSIQQLFPNLIEYKSNHIKPSSHYNEPLLKLASLLKKYPNSSLLITAQSDEKNSALQNKLICSKRASYIKTILIKNGITADRIESWGLGSLSLSTSKKSTNNKCAEFVLLYNDSKN